MEVQNEGYAGIVFVQLMKYDIKDQTRVFMHWHYGVTPAEV